MIPQIILNLLCDTIKDYGGKYECKKLYIKFSINTSGYNFNLNNI